MRKLFIILAAAMLATGAMAQGPHNRHHGGHSNHGYHHRPPVEQYYIECASAEQMQMVIQTLKAQSFDDKRLEIAKLCVTIGYFCTDDMAVMANTFSFDDNRLAFLKYAYNYCLDRENYPKLRNCFTFSSNYNELMDYIYQ